MQPGAIGWLDLTVPDAPQLRDFYGAVIGWKPAPVDMGGYEDFNMTGADGNPVAGICHARGVNADLPPIWMVYFIVEDLDASVASCEKLGGTVLSASRSAGESRYCVIRDPAGVVSALVEATPREVVA